MQVLKFGGSSLADAKNMLKAADIIAKATDRDRTIVVASAIYKCTDTLIRIGNLAAEHDSSYLELLDKLQDEHHQIIRELLPVEKYEESTEVENAGTASEDDIITLYGAGWGHGVGLCQIGAAMMAARGYGYREILSHYYPGSICSAGKTTDERKEA